MEVELLVQLVPTGQVISVSVVRSSGNSAFDRSAEQAVHKVGRFEKLKEIENPRVFDKYFRRLTLVFRPDDLRL
jgi:colicin import membrane protein